MKTKILTDKCFVLFLFTIGFPVQIDVDVVDDGQVVELEMLTPKAQVVLLFAGRSCVHALVQTKFAEIPLQRKKKRKLGYTHGKSGQS